MLRFVVAVGLLVFCLLGVMLYKVYFYLPAKELKRQAEHGDRVSTGLWRAVAYGRSLKLLLWLWIGLSAAAGFVLLARIAPWYIGFVAIALLLWLAVAWFPRRTRLSHVEAKLGLWLTPSLSWLLNYLHPLFDVGLSRLKPATKTGHTSLYETEDLMELLERQEGQSDNRITASDLDRLKRLLAANHQKVSDILTPRSQVKSLSDQDTIGPILLDELHESGQTIFPVKAGKADKIIGTLYLGDLGLKTEGRIGDYLQPDVRYLHEDDSLSQAMQAFYRTRHQLFLVVNSFQEYVGIVTLKRLMQQLAGEPPSDDFDLHHDLAAVAAKHHQSKSPAVPADKPVPKHDNHETPPAVADQNIVPADLAALDLPEEPKAKSS